MTTTHFAGINTRQIANSAEGHPVLISFASMLDGHHKCLTETVLPMLADGRFRSSILDSGAFTVLSQNITISIEQYIAFCLEYGHLFDTVVTLDDISGDLATTWENTRKMIEAGLDPIPVFHGREPFEVLAHYCEKFDRIGLGFFRAAAKQGGRVSIAKDQGEGLSPDEWLEKALDICEAAGVEVHGFGMTRFALKKGHTRLSSSDSTSWNAEYLALRARKAEGGDRLGDGDAALALCGCTDEELMQLAMASYNPIQSGLGPDQEMIDLTQDCAGQAKTVLQRFTGQKLWIQMEFFELENARLIASV